MSLGELLVDYRQLNNISQADFAAELNVDTRTVSRWEKDMTLIKSEKEEELVEKTFIPYQVIRNLNATVAIPTFYDFRLRKYTTDELSNSLPLADWVRTKMDSKTNRLRPVEFDSDYENILRYSKLQYATAKPFSKDLIKEAVRLLPELNLVLSDNSGYYSGHIVFFPINLETNNKLRNRLIKEENLLKEDLVDYRKEEVPVFHLLDVSADCSENVFYILGSMLRFFKDFKKPYLYSSFTTRADSYEMNKQAGIKLIWEDKKEQTKQCLDAPPRFYEGNFDKFLSEGP